MNSSSQLQLAGDWAMLNRFLSKAAFQQRSSKARSLTCLCLSSGWAKPSRFAEAEPLGGWVGSAKTSNSSCLCTTDLSTLLMSSTLSNTHDIQLSFTSSQPFSRCSIDKGHISRSLCTRYFLLLNQCSTTSFLQYIQLSRGFALNERTLRDLRPRQRLTSIRLGAKSGQTTWMPYSPLFRTPSGSPI